MVRFRKTRYRGRSYPKISVGSSKHRALYPCYPTSHRHFDRAHLCGGIAIQGGIYDERPRHRQHRTVHARLIPRVDARILGARPSHPRFIHLERPPSSTTSTTHSHRVGAGRGGGRIRGVHGIFFHRRQTHRRAARIRRKRACRARGSTSTTPRRPRPDGSHGASVSLFLTFVRAIRLTIFVLCLQQASSEDSASSPYSRPWRGARY